MPNRLADETSPYLLQHKDNPVDWYPWGPEALERAEAEDKPLLLSIGYAACHWCHVMERESFEDPDVAAVMNEHFVCVKVDREERPDVDSIYMSATQALTGQGGWPMTVFCMPDGTPFLAGTYFPPEERHGMPSFRRVLEQVDELWTTRREDLLTQGQRLLEAIERATPPPSREPLQAGLLTAAASQTMRSYDPANGGFGGAPKFPQAPNLEFMLRMSGRVSGVREAVDNTLHKMALGGIYDQIGGGFARYAVDATWTVPHFEKMLYDNAQLARVYTHAWQARQDLLYERIAIETLEYLLRDMRDETGGFHSSEDADSEGVEGKFYVWEYDEFKTIAPEAAQYYGVTPDGNFEGKNILIGSEGDPQAEARARLLEVRSRRVRPGKDDKVLASWNGMAIAALAEAGAAFGRTDFIDAAREAADFVLGKLAESSTELLHTYRAGRAHVRGLLEDYAFLADGLIALWEATFHERWITAARTLSETALERFGDPNQGGFYTAPPTHDLIVRQKEIVESATPAPGAVLALVLQKLAVMYDAPDLAKSAVDALRLAHPYMERAAQAVPSWLSALDFYVSTPKEIAFTGPLDDALLSVVTSRFLPNRVMAAGNGEIALMRDKPATTAATAYVCERYACQAPTSDPQELAKQLA
ncbi:MAG: thioredoxin domain-containing protein [Actinomycetota bacterium]